MILMKRGLFLLLVLPMAFVSFGSRLQPDSVIVVKGQVSDYYITITKERVVKGTVQDRNGNPLEGATVMLKSSPVHCNTDIYGHYTIKVGPQDSLLFVYYPRMHYALVTLPKEAMVVDVVMADEQAAEGVKKQKAKITRWYNPYSYSPSTYCNPTNISYNFEPYNNNVKANGSFRSSADPMIVTYKDEYFLFSTNQGGFHRSKDLSNWEFVSASFQRKPTDDDQCAPAAFVNGDTLFYTGSTYSGLPVWYSTNPVSGKFKRLIERNDLPTWDPYIFLDDDGRLYEYYGSSNEYPLKGVEIDRNTFSPISKIHDIMELHPSVHGWERFGMNNDDSTTLAPFTEGAFMTKHNGKYYFQYGAPGTEFKVYADGVYVSDSPLGPFRYQEHNPMCYKPGGFVRGAGHGGTFKDLYGNYWHVATCMLSLKYKFERRIGIYPVAFDTDGAMYSSTTFGDYPTCIPSKRTGVPSDSFSGWMLLSYGKQITASSFEEGHSPDQIADESMRTYWAAKSGDKGEWISMDMGTVKEVRALQLNYYDHKAFQHNKAMDIYHQYQIFHSVDGKSWELVIDKSDSDMDVPHDYVELLNPLKTRFIKVVNVHMPTGFFALLELRVFGNGLGAAPDKVRNFKAERDLKDSRNIRFSWLTSKNAYGYNIYYGTTPAKMYNSIAVLNSTEYDFRGLDAGKSYFFSIEAIGESGRSEMSKTIKK